MKKLYLVDVSSMYFRAFYAIRPLSNAQGMPTNALYGFLSMTVKLLKQNQPDYLAFCFDNKHPSFRKEMYSEYKANRSEMPEDLVPQVPYVGKITDVLGLPAFNVEGYEADDLIGALTAFGRQNDVEVVIVSGDKDFGQLVAPYVSMYDTMKDVRYDVQGVQDKWGIPPEQVIDYLALVGDSSDNVPGVRGIGPKGAQKLLAEFANLEEIYASIDRVKNKNVAKKLQESRDMAFLSKKLVTIVQDIQLVQSLEELKRREIRREDLSALLEELDFKSFERNLLGLTREQSAPKPQEPRQELRQAPQPPRPEEAQNAPTGDFSAEVVPNGVAEAVVVSSAAGELIERSVEMGALDQLIQPEQPLWAMMTERGVFFSDEREVWIVQGEIEALQRLVADKNVLWQGHDLKSIWQTLRPRQPRAHWDQMLAAYVVRAGAAESFEQLCARYVGGHLPELASPGQLIAQQIQLKRSLQERLKKVNGEKVYYDLDLPLAPILYAMEVEGIGVDVQELSEQSQGLTQDIKKLEQLIHELAGESFNVASTKQLGHILFEKMGIPALKKTKTGFSTDSDVLEKLSADHEIARQVIEFRELSKLKSTYVDALPLLVNKDTGKIHTHFNQAHTATGRLSSHDPNLQNIPIRTPRGHRVRRAFIAGPGRDFLSIDYSQIELRILAHITEDEGLCRAFCEGRDIHAATASLVFGVDLEAVDAHQRRTAKAVNFGIAYGQGPYGLAGTLGVSRKEATEIIAQYFNRFPKVRDYMHDVVAEGQQRGYVETLLGRRRILEELQSKNGRLRKFGERAAINAPIQGTASDIVKKAMIDIYTSGQRGMLLQVHDELLFEVDHDQVASKGREIATQMEQVMELRVPLSVHVAHGKNWQEAHA